MDQLDIIEDIPEAAKQNSTVIFQKSSIKILTRYMEPVEFTITATNGKIIASGLVQQNNGVITIRNLSKGMYILYLECKALKQVNKFQTVNK